MVYKIFFYFANKDTNVMNTSNKGIIESKSKQWTKKDVIFEVQSLDCFCP